MMNPKLKRKLPVYTFNFSKINKPLAIVIGFVLCLIVGYYNQTDIYDQLNKLPENRNELTPIRQISVSVEGSKLRVDISLHAVIYLTRDNLYENIKAHISAGNETYKVGAGDTPDPKRETDFFSFSYNISFKGNVFVQLFLHDTPITEKREFIIA
ncbi:hypothetical protein TRFO_03588 [Tritrichomonas foetus]|uniref:Uncharacterized protein n=1 Tax=Tritrichomonas foetus TaxID=1144522 RepID=A0A1J4KSX2_9EUKA|nr:hypothetical protein TRFO_03588 [Tritrichomonas foetus]|eukprot:OHT12581.1 hypothetical protein TRFO_03588 [Tritrichomonas foetus]